MDFFNETWAARIQYFTLPLEVVGFTLTSIEVLFPELADRIERLVDKLGKSSNSFHDKLRRYYGKPAEMALPVFPLILLTLMVYPFFSRWWGMYPQFKTAIYMFIVFGALYLTYWISFFLGKLIDVLNKVTSGRALGTLGLVLAFLGLLGEAYQYITMVGK